MRKQLMKMSVLAHLHYQSYRRLAGHFVMNCISTGFGAGKGGGDVTCQKDKKTLHLSLGEIQVCLI